MMARCPCPTRTRTSAGSHSFRIPATRREPATFIQAAVSRFEVCSERNHCFSAYQLDHRGLNLELVRQVISAFVHTESAGPAISTSVMLGICVPRPLVQWLMFVVGWATRNYTANPGRSRCIHCFTLPYRNLSSELFSVIIQLCRSKAHSTTTQLSSRMGVHHY